MKYGWNNMIGLNINIPIFDNRQNKSAVQKARLQYDSSLLDLINKQKELYKNIESLWLDATNAQEQYAAAESIVPRYGEITMKAFRPSPFTGDMHTERRIFGIASRCGTFEIGRAHV